MQKAVPEEAAAVTSALIHIMISTKHYITNLFCFFALLHSLQSIAAILPEERADILYHSYDGGGVTIDGPSILIRKNVGDKFSFSGNYYVDMVTSASVDVDLITGGSEYTEERTEYSLGMDYLNDRTIMSLSYANSTENDYIADTISYSISQEFFGDLSTLTLGFALGDDTVKATGSESFEAGTNRKRYSVGFSQILTKRFIASFSYEAVFDEGFLRNPYRLVRTVDPDASLTCDQNNGEQGGECYPGTRNSDAYAIRGIYALNNNSSVRAEYRQFSDSWGLESQNYELRYTYQLGSRWLLEGRLRLYEQGSGAFFYQDIFDTDARSYEFYARDKELSTFTSTQYGLSVSYTFKSKFDFFNNSTLNFSWDHMIFEYDNFRDATKEGFERGSEPFYELEADVFRIFYSAYF